MKTTEKLNVKTFPSQFQYQNGKPEMSVRTQPDSLRNSTTSRSRTFIHSQNPGRVGPMLLFDPRILHLTSRIYNPNPGTTRAFLSIRGPLNRSKTR